MALGAIFRAFGLTLGQIGDPRFARVLGIGAALALLGLAAFSAGLFWLVGWFTGESVQLPMVGEVRWLDDVLSWGAVLLILVLSVFLMTPVTSAIMSLFLDDVADAVEAVHYPHLPQKPRTPFWEALRDSVNYLGVMIAVNALALVLYFLFSPLALVIFWLVNGLLLGREYFALVAMRRVGRLRANELRRRHAFTVWAAGTLTAIPLTVPVLNLAVPILGAATFTHLFHFLTAERPDRPNSPDRRR